ncbi:flavin-containing monooxygenase 5-like [Amphiura filiformis]|uniref:flavin-containing monooxygenase 5-like n=1 Tax=Amphiura filiformis TaxID=82378 RepID=UPI003B216983
MKKTMAERQRSTDVCVIGAGISGLATAKCLRDAGFDVVVLERTGEVGGLWVFREHGYGVMRFTHINVSKQNYCFSDFPFPDDVPDFPHNTDMAKYIVDYTMQNKLNEVIRFETQARKLERQGDGWKITTVRVEDDGKGGCVEVGDEEVILSKFVAIASGHHAKPSWPKFPGQESFKGEIIHSVDYKCAISNGFVGKRVLIVGIGNSAVDAAGNAITEGRCKEVHLSTRSGAWVVPNYIFGCPVDHYACRLFLWLPWKLATFIFETVLALLQGHPRKWNLNPKMHALQTQPTVSPTLVHHIQRGNLKVHPNISKMEGKCVHFTNGDSIEVDHVIFCTGYHIDIPFLSDEIKQTVMDESSNSIQLYKNVFSPVIGHTLAFIGFLQPASGGILSMAETQARWFAELCRGTIRLPSKRSMENDLKSEQEMGRKRYFASARHTIQRDPIIYSDEVTAMFGAKPQFWRHPSLAWRLLVGSCGAAQYRLQGPGKWSKAYETVKSVPVTAFTHYGTLAAVIVLAFLILYVLRMFL